MTGYLSQWEQERAEAAARRKAVKLLPVGKRPRCLGCSKELQPYVCRGQEWAVKRGMVYGGRGDNRFCSLRCGYAWATRNTRAEWALARVPS